MSNLKDTNKKQKNEDIVILIDRKIAYFQDVIQKTMKHVQKNKVLEILAASSVNVCTSRLIELSKNIKTIVNNDKNIDNNVNTLQLISNDLSSILKNFGTESFEDLLIICFGNNSMNTYAISETDKQKFDLLKKYFHPTKYELLSSKKETESNDLTENSKNLDCRDIMGKSNKFRLKVFGISLIVHNNYHNKSIIISGIVDDVSLEIINNQFVSLKMESIKQNMGSFDAIPYNRFVDSLNLKDCLLYEPHQICCKYAGYVSNLNAMRQKSISKIIQDFLSSDIFTKRLTIIQFLIKSDIKDNEYIAYLLFDLLSNDSNNNIYTHDQELIMDSFPWSIKQHFKDAMKNTIDYTVSLNNFDIQKIPLEQQICLMKANESVKEKAMQKFKELKSKSEDSSGSKARQYLDGLLKIPFSIYRKEPILNTMNDIRSIYNEIMKETNKEQKDGYTSLEILKTIKELKNSVNDDETTEENTLILTKINNHLNALSHEEIKCLIADINKYIKNNDIHSSKITLTANKHKKTHQEKISDIMNFVKENQTNNEVIQLFNVDLTHKKSKDSLSVGIKEIESKYSEINSYMNDIKNTLNDAIHGHNRAKKQIERIIGQWINGKQDGYCFGFEGPAGVGKTTLAKKGLAKCLKDENGVPRPFAMIQMGGDTNGSSLHGHNYTYVGSSWGSIVQILMDKKCMNPIIFIDEVDKISKTESGKEIIGILTHLLDPAQNDCFQDKYFSGIELDLSKALFILSYNDVELIDKIMLDRIHRIKFDNLSLEEKITISNTYLLPEIYDKMGLKGMINLNKDVLKYIINEYTLESGVRKLKEILFEIVAEINLDILKNMNVDYDIPINISIDDITNKYFKEKRGIKNNKIHSENKIGIINGLWANSFGVGGVLSIQAKWRPSEKFMGLHLTGMQGDVMKESMNVALTLAWNLTSYKMKEEIQECEKSGIHVHCPEGATPKDGPSAGAAITVAIYSLMNNVKIKSNIAITGEITLDGNITGIGGLELKILGGIKAGVTEFIYPKENEKDFDDFQEKYKSQLTSDILFHSVDKIEQVFQLIFE